MTYTCTPEHALEKLLELCPLTFREIRFYTCWDPEKAMSVVRATAREKTVTLHTDWSGARYWSNLQLRTHLAQEARRRGEAAVKLAQPSAATQAATFLSSPRSRKSSS